MRHTWGEDRVFFFGDDGSVVSLPRAWTSEADPDVFVELAGDRCWFRVADLLDLVEICQGLGNRRRGRSVRRTLPSM
jgi:hypothetical protein